MLRASHKVLSDSPNNYLEQLDTGRRERWCILDQNTESFAEGIRQAENFCGKCCVFLEIPFRRAMPGTDEASHDDFLRFYAESEASLRTFVHTILPVREDASEVLQETILVLWRRFAEYDRSRDFKSWAFGIARVKAMSLLRDRRRDRHVFDDELVGRLADEAVLLDQRHASHREALERCLEKLPEGQREFVLAAYAKGARIDKIAARRGQTPMSLYKLLHRIRQALLECVTRTVSKEAP